MDKKKLSNIPYLAPILLVSILLSARSLSSDGYMSVLIEDTYAFTSWAWQFTESLKNGVVYPRWMSLDFWGYGSPTFILYPPLSYYAIALFENFSSSVLQAMNFIKFVSVFSTGIGIYFLIKKRFESIIALSSAIIFISSPFYVFYVNCYGTFAAICSIPLLPIILKKVFDFYESENKVDIAFSGIFYGLLLMTHLITAYMFAFVIFTLFVVKFNRNKPFDLPINLGIFVCISLLTSSPYILPLIFEINNLQIENFVDHKSGFDYKNFFIVPFKYSLTNPFWNEYNFIFRINFIICSIFILILICLTVFNFKYYNIDKKFTVALSAVATFTIFVQTSWSQFIWILIPYFNFVQFPSRWTIITCLLVSILIPDLLYDFRNVLKSDLYLSFLLGCIFIIVISIDMILINNSHIFQNTSLLPVKSINWTNEHLPNGVDIDYIKNINHNIDFLTSLRCDITYEAIEWTAQERTFLIDSVGSSEVRIRHFYFPGWKAYINGKEISVEKDKFTKGMIVTLPEGKSTFKIIFVDTPIRKFSKYIFVLFILLFSAFYFWNLKNHRLQSKIYY